MLNLPDSEKTLTRRNFISETSTDLRAGERNSAVVELQKSLEIDEVTLSGFRTKVAVKVNTSAIRFVS
jgi:hypothetical protein